MVIKELTSMIIEEISPCPEILTTFEKLRNQPFPFLLDSAMDPEKLGRFSFMSSNPFLVLKSKGRDVTLFRGGKKESLEVSPFEVLQNLLEEHRVPQKGLPFLAGAVGYFAYDLGRLLERIPKIAKDDLKLPEIYLCFYDGALVFDNRDRRAFLTATDRRARERLLEILSSSPELELERGGGEVKLCSNFSREGYFKAVEQAKEYIGRGEIYQVNLSQRFEVELPFPAWSLYKRLREINPSPFAAFLDFPEVQVVSASPERFLKLSGTKVQTRPIKGTRPCGRTFEEDETLARELLSSEKDRAENIMIVDLERNDLGKVCHFGTVKVPELCILEKFPTVFHLTSTVEGELRERKGPVDLLKACFPGGSITGAPKVRAMEIIEELEPTRRSIYTGSIGYMSFSGDMDLNIAIRTFLIKENQAYFQVGGGIVSDSNPEAEYQETLDKARALISALELVPEIVNGKGRNCLP